MDEDDEIDLRLENSYIKTSQVIEETKELHLKTEQSRMKIKAARLH